MPFWPLLLQLAAGLAVAGALALRPVSPEQRLARLQRQVAPRGGVVFRTVLDGRPTALLLLDCKVQRLDPTAADLRRETVLEPEFYLGFTVCLQQAIRLQDGYVRVEFVRRPLGAGGGGAASYRSLDGRSWERFSRDGWHPVATPA